MPVTIPRFNAYEYLKKEAQIAWNNYQPIFTEINGIKDVVIGTSALALALQWKLSAPSNLEFNLMDANRAIKISGVAIAQGLMQLALPIITVTGYTVCRICI